VLMLATDKVLGLFIPAQRGGSKAS
jgi:hypothetical protein